MKQIKVTDMTLEMGVATLSFKEKIEIARQLDNLKVDVIDMPEIVNVTTDSLLIRTICAFAKNSTISVRQVERSKVLSSPQQQFREQKAPD